MFGHHDAAITATSVGASVGDSTGATSVSGSIGTSSVFVNGGAAYGRGGTDAPADGSSHWHAHSGAYAPHTPRGSRDVRPRCVCGATCVCNAAGGCVGSVRAWSPAHSVSGGRGGTVDGGTTPAPMCRGPACPCAEASAVGASAMSPGDRPRVSSSGSGGGRAAAASGAVDGAGDASRKRKRDADGAGGATHRTSDRASPSRDRGHLSDTDARRARTTGEAASGCDEHDRGNDTGRDSVSLSSCDDRDYDGSTGTATTVQAADPSVAVAMGELGARLVFGQRGVDLLRQSHRHM